MAMLTAMLSSRWSLLLMSMSLAVGGCASAPPVVEEAPSETIRTTEQPLSLQPALTPRFQREGLEVANGPDDTLVVVNGARQVGVGGPFRCVTMTGGVMGNAKSVRLTVTITAVDIADRSTVGVFSHSATVVADTCKAAVENQKNLDKLFAGAVDQLLPRR
jgi:hypothetical protein